MEDKIEVGEYVRYYGRFYIVIGSYERNRPYDLCIQLGDFKTKKFCGEDYQSEMKISPNIIDLIEVGDYVNGHRIMMDLEKSKKHYKSNYDFVTAVGYTFEENEIKSIVTKEQFESVKYEVKEQEEIITSFDKVSDFKE